MFRNGNILSVKFWLEMEWSCWGFRKVRKWVGPLFLLYKHPALGGILDHVSVSQGSLLIISISMLHKGKEYIFGFS